MFYVFRKQELLRRKIRIIRAAAKEKLKLFKVSIGFSKTHQRVYL